MRAHRRKGRPVRTSDEQGRERILSATLKYLQNRVQTEVVRQDIATVAGVTPALVTYYFESKSELLLAATAPVLRSAIDAVRDVIAAQLSYRDRLNKLISLFIRFSAKNSRILEAFIQASLQADDRDNQGLVLSAFNDMQSFFVRGAQAGEWRSFDPTFFIFAVWGMCKFVGEPPAFPIQMFSAELAEEHSWDLQAGLITELLTYGISPRPDDARPSGPVLHL